MHCRKHVVQVHHHKNRFDELDARVFVVGFEPERRATDWLAREDLTFSFLLDEEREVYQAYELPRSFWRSWHPKNLWSYAKALLRGEKLPQVQADPNQLGGDFVIDGDGIIRLAYYSKNATDRPSVDELLSVLRKLQQEGRT
jgi:peroxiredoxin